MMVAQIEGGGPLAAMLAGEFACVPDSVGSLLVNADATLDSAVIMARCERFAAACPADKEALIITILSEPADDLAAQAAAGGLWAFTRAAALAWAARGIRVNAIGLGAAPVGPFEPQEQSGVAAVRNVPAAPATLADIVRTIRAIASWPSMTGQIIRLGV